MNRIKFTLLIITAVIGLTACAQSSGAEEQSSVETTTIAAQVSVAEDSSSKAEGADTMLLTVETIKYENEQLTFLYEGESYTLPLKRDSFKDNYILRSSLGKELSEQVINNKLGENITALIKVNKDMTNIILCDIVNQNGVMYGESGKLVRKEGSLCELVGEDLTLTADLNDLSFYEKLDFPNEMNDVSWGGYLFEDGKFILNSLGYFEKENENGTQSYRGKNNKEYPAFPGTVQSCDGERAQVLLNDGVTLCDVPTYFCEHELEAGNNVLMILDSELSLYGSGEERSFDYAVILTDEDDYFHSIHEFEDIAYARASENTMGEFVYTTKDKVVE